MTYDIHSIKYTGLDHTFYFQNHLLKYIEESTTWYKKLFDFSEREIFLVHNYNYLIAHINHPELCRLDHNRGVLGLKWASKVLRPDDIVDDLTVSWA